MPSSLGLALLPGEPGSRFVAGPGSRRGPGGPGPRQAACVGRRALPASGAARRLCSRARVRQCYQQFVFVNACFAPYKQAAVGARIKFQTPLASDGFLDGGRASEKPSSLLGGQITLAKSSVCGAAVPFPWTEKLVAHMGSR
ncbi:unnamed protein product [Prorocentrum cordatum]|uniref:Uncharacterized protein n=1 Tax=Prorocentrum cordatum TaxID=2364126 RepID=A0ABN9SZL4_9DINO|nr:unnamed protein product [Polarella glacialis]